jgi:hypothetical protein
MMDEINAPDDLKASNKEKKLEGLLKKKIELEEAIGNFERPRSLDKKKLFLVGSAFILYYYYCILLYRSRVAKLIFLQKRLWRWWRCAVRFRRSDQHSRGCPVLSL